MEIRKSYLTAAEAASELGVTEQKLIELVDHYKVAVAKYINGNYKFSNSTIRRVRLVINKDNERLQIRREAKKIASENQKKILEVQRELRNLQTHNTSRIVAINNKLAQIQLDGF